MSFLNEMLPETAETFGQMKDAFLDVKSKEFNCYCFLSAHALPVLC